MLQNSRIEDFQREKLPICRSQYWANCNPAVNRQPGYRREDSLSSARRVIYPTGGNLAVYSLQKIGDFSFWKSIILEFCNIRGGWDPIYLLENIKQ